MFTYRKIQRKIRYHCSIFIENGSIADRQGEFQCGDQIIQINNEKVFNREQAIELIQGISLLIFQILRFQVKNLSITTPLTENDSGIILPFEKMNYFHKHLRKRSNSLPCLTTNRQSNKHIFSRHCYTLNDVRKTFKFDSISSFRQSESSFETTDDEILSEFKQGRYWTRQERKEHFQKSKQYRRKKTYSLKNTTDDFNLLNRIFLRENQEELKEKPYLALQFIIHQQLLFKYFKKISMHSYSYSTSNVNDGFEHNFEL
ncbi:hypothetical protein I4U23_031265 [Adineta vaga]|nr:hypothetical protein I4U23_031265 [Adineta vaga]